MRLFPPLPVPSILGKRETSDVGVPFDLPSRPEKRRRLLPIDLGVATWNVNHTQKQKAKVASLQRLFDKNPWLDVVVLQEVNKEELLAPLTGGLLVTKGPQMVNVNHLENRMGRTLVEGGVDVIAAQYEYYPIVMRAGQQRVTVADVQAYDGRKLLPPGDIQWTKPLEVRSGWTNTSEAYQVNVSALNVWLPPYRPIIVYTLHVGEVVVRLGVVHTSPSGKKLGRQGEFKQIKDFLEHVMKPDEAWILAGDFYLDEESSVFHNSNPTSRGVEQLFRTALEELKLRPIVPVSATNMSVLSHKTTTLKVETGKLGDSWELFGGQLAVNKRADFFIATPWFEYSRAHLLSPRAMPLISDPNHHALTWWSRVSDHAPVGGMFSSDLESEQTRSFQADLASDRRQVEQVRMEVQMLHNKAVLDLHKLMPSLIQEVMKAPLNQEEQVALSRLCAELRDRIRANYAQTVSPSELSHPLFTVTVPEPMEKLAGVAGFRREECTRLLNATEQNPQAWSLAPGLRAQLLKVADAWRLLERRPEDYEGAWEYDTYADVNPAKV
ncbi:endonuclease/exonuclease/phosphatase family protein [Corallococcus sp. M7]